MRKYSSKVLQYTAMSKTTSKPQAPYHTKTLTDDEYNELMRQKEIKERPERAKQRLRNYEDRQYMKFGFIAGTIVGAGLLFLILVLFGAVNL